MGVGKNRYCEPTMSLSHIEEKDYEDGVPTIVEVKHCLPMV